MSCLISPPASPTSPYPQREREIYVPFYRELGVDDPLGLREFRKRMDGMIRSLESREGRGGKRLQDSQRSSGTRSGVILEHMRGRLEQFKESLSTIKVKGERPSEICKRVKPSGQISNMRTARNQGECDLAACDSGAEPEEGNHREAEEFNVKRLESVRIRDCQISSIRINPSGQENQRRIPLCQTGDPPDASRRNESEKGDLLQSFALDRGTTKACSEAGVLPTTAPRKYSTSTLLHHGEF